MDNLRDTCTKIIDLIPLEHGPISFDIKIVHDTSGVYGEYWVAGTGEKEIYSKNTLLISDWILDKPDTLFHTLIHEMIHAIMFQEMQIKSFDDYDLLLHEGCATWGELNLIDNKYSHSLKRSWDKLLTNPSEDLMKEYVLLSGGDDRSLERYLDNPESLLVYGQGMKICENKGGWDYIQRLIECSVIN